MQYDNQFDTQDTVKEKKIKFNSLDVMNIVGITVSLHNNSYPEDDSFYTVSLILLVSKNDKKTEIPLLLGTEVCGGDKLMVAYDGILTALSLKDNLETTVKVFDCDGELAEELFVSDVLEYFGNTDYNDSI